MIDGETKQLKKDLDILNDILGRLLCGDITILTLDTKQFLATKATSLLQLQVTDKYVLESIKTLVQICNILYNRSDILVLPVDDPIYDGLVELYKQHDPNFQVGSAVVQLQSQYEHEGLIEEHKNALFFYKEEQRDEIREQFNNQIRSFDNNKFDKRDIYRNPITFEQQENYISKRTHDTKHNHPDLVGTLDKCKYVLIQDAIDADVIDDPSVTILERDFFHDHIKRGIITENQELEMVIELKYDGISVEADCNKVVQSARTRGDTGIGEAADITPILKGYPFHRNNIVVDFPIGVKFEAIILRSDMPRFNEMRGHNYANCRTAMVGLFGNSDSWKYRDLITLIPIAVDRDQVHNLKNRLEEIEFINRLFQSHGEPLRYAYIKGNFRTCLYLIKKFAEEAFAARSYLDFMFDGIVVSYLDEDIRQKLGRKNYINKYQTAVKFNPMTKLTTFFNYTYEVGANGVITPMIHYAPVEFIGTIHPKSSGNSYKRFMDLNLKPGDIIQVTYRNDVMPYVTSIDCEHNRQNTNPPCEFPTECPICGSSIQISDSGKSAICTNKMCNGRKLSRMVNMLNKLNIKGFAENTIRSLGVYTFKDLMSLWNKQEYVTEVLGPTNADNLLSAINHVRFGANFIDYEVVGALGFTNLGKEFWKLIFSEYTLAEFICFMENTDWFSEVKEELLKIKNVGLKSIQTIFDEWNLFIDDLLYISTCIKIINSKDYILNRHTVRFTGCRNKQLEEQLNSMGYDADGNGSVTKSTDILVVPYDGFVSNKIKKVDPNHTVIVSMEEFISDTKKYLSLIKDEEV